MAAKKSIFADVLDLAGLKDAKNDSAPEIDSIHSQPTGRFQSSPANGHCLNWFGPSPVGPVALMGLCLPPPFCFPFIHWQLAGNSCCSAPIPLKQSIQEIPAGYAPLAPLPLPLSVPSVPRPINLLASNEQQKSGISLKFSATKKPPTSCAPRFKCPDCNRSYSTFSGLSKHRQFHCASQQKRNFYCKFCDKEYGSLGALKMHIRTHTLPCKCTLCGKAFSRPWLLQGHLRTHTGEKPFVCQTCGRQFADRSNLRAHLQTHSEIKKYKCRFCQKTFSRMSLLNKHESSGCPGKSLDLKLF